MCSSLAGIASNVNTPIPLSCQRNDLCTSVDCSVKGSGSEFSASLQVLPCSESIVVMSDQGQQMFNRTGDQSSTQSDGSSATFSVVLNNYNYSMDLQVLLI